MKNNSAHAVKENQQNQKKQKKQKKTKYSYEIEESYHSPSGVPICAKYVGFCFFWFFWFTSFYLSSRMEGGAGDGGKAQAGEEAVKGQENLRKKVPDQQKGSTNPMGFRNIIQKRLQSSRAPQLHRRLRRRKKGRTKSTFRRSWRRRRRKRRTS